MRILFLILFNLSFCIFHNAEAGFYSRQGNDKKIKQNYLSQKTNPKDIKQNSAGLNISNNLRRKMQNASKIGNGAGGYMAFDRQEYNQDKQQEQINSSARRRFTFINPSKFGNLNNINNNARYNTSLRKSNPFAISNYIIGGYSNSISTTLHSDKQYGGKNSNTQLMQKAYGFSFGYGTRLFESTKFTKINNNADKNYNTIGRRAIFGNKLQKTTNTRRSNKLNALIDKINNLRANIAQKLGQNLLFSEFSLNATFNEFVGEPDIANAAPINKSFGGIYLSEKIIIMPSILKVTIKLPRSYNLPIAGFIYPEIGYGLFSYKNILSYDKNMLNNSGKTPTDEVVKQNTTGLVYGFGGGLIANISNILRSQHDIFVRVEIKYLKFPSFAVTAANKNLNENVSFSNTSLNTSLIIKFN